MYYFKLSQNEKGQYSFNLKAGNHETVLTSEQYESKAGAENGIESVQKNATNDDRFERKVNKAEAPYFVLKAGNGQVIGVSEAYSSESAMEATIKKIQENAPTAETKEA